MGGSKKMDTDALTQCRRRRKRAHELLENLTMASITDIAHSYRLDGLSVNMANMETVGGQVDEGHTSVECLEFGFRSAVGYPPSTLPLEVQEVTLT